MDTKSIGGGKVRIGVDAGCLGVTDERLKVGVYQVVKSLLIELGKIDADNEYFLYSFSPIEIPLMKEFGSRMKNIVVKPSKGWLKIWLPLRLLIDKPKVFLALNQAAPMALVPLSYKILGIFYDIAFEKFPDFYSYATSVKKHKSNSRNLAQTADVIVAISEKTKQDLFEIYKTHKNKITVAYPGIVSLSTVEPQKYQLPYFLFVGAFKKSKNIPTLIKAYAEFVEVSKKQYDLFLIGGDKWLDPEIEKVLKNNSQNVQKHVKILGYVNEAKLANLYSGAVAFVSPSLYEGFGLPFVEAMSVGCPVIGSTRGSIPEVVGDAGVLLDPYDVNGLAHAMERVATDKNLRANLSKKGIERSKRYSFQTFAKAIYSAIESLA